MHFGTSAHKWISFFSLCVLTRARAYVREEGYLIFDVHDDGSLCYTHRENELFYCCLQKEVRLIANDGSNLFLDMNPHKVNILWRF